MTAELHKTRVDLAGLMRVLGEHLYSTPTVALRELVQNAHDSCERRRLEDLEAGTSSGASAPRITSSGASAPRITSSGASAPRITVVADPSERSLSIEDSGAGLTDDEVERYLATVGAGYTRTLRDRDPEASKGLIGYFGLGFLSAFVVADRVSVWTCSYQTPDRAWRFVSRDGQTYTLEPAPARPVGTRVTLALGERFAELANPLAIRRLLARFASLLAHPVHCPLDGSFEHGGPAVNAEPPPWRDSREHSELRKRKLALEFAARFESQFEPLCVLPLGEAGPLRGMIWVQDSATYGSSDNRRAWVFVRGMMISDDARELLPRWAGFCGAVIETDVLTPTASREDLQRDANFDLGQAQIREALIEGLATLARREGASWRRILARHNEALLGAALLDDRLFTLIAEQATLPTSQGDLVLERIRERSQGRIYISQAERGGFEELLFRALGVPVIKGSRYAAAPIARRWAERQGISAIALGTQTSEQALFHRLEDHELGDPRIGPSLREAFAGRHFAASEATNPAAIEVVLSRFAPTHLPFVLVPDREVELKRRIEADQADKRISSAALGLARIFTATIVEGPPLRLHLNLDCPAIDKLGRRLAQTDANDPASGRALALLRPLVALLSQIDELEQTMSSEQALRELCSLAEHLLGPQPA